jgi:hypothetical protein
MGNSPENLGEDLTGSLSPAEADIEPVVLTIQLNPKQFLDVQLAAEKLGVSVQDFIIGSSFDAALHTLTGGPND